MEYILKNNKVDKIYCLLFYKAIKLSLLRDIEIKLGNFQV